MPVVSAAIAVVGLLCLLDLLLTFGVIRRLREHTALLRDRQPPAGPPVIGLTAGQAPEPFGAMTADGVRFTGPAGLRLVGFFADWCSACPDRVAPFGAYARANQVARNEVLAVLLAGDDGPPSYADQLAEFALVAEQPAGNSIARAFGVAGYPAFCLLDANGVVLASGYDPGALPAPVMA